MKKLGIYTISYELLAELLRLDENHKVVDVFSERRDREYSVVSIKVEGPLMTETLEGNPVMYKRLDQIGMEAL